MTTSEHDRRSSSAAAPRRPPTVLLIVTLGALVALGPWTIDAYLPALPAMADELDANATELQLSLTAALAGLGGGQLIVGPLSDAVGRRGPLIVGLAVYVVASIGVAAAPNVACLVGARLLQGAGASAGAVTALAVLRDLTAGRELARKLSLLMLVTGIAPMVAPTAGAQVLLVASWRALFLCLAVMGLVLAAWVAWHLPETHASERRVPFRPRTTIHAYRRHARHAGFVVPAIAVAGLTTVMFAYISGSAFLLQGQLGLSESEYALVFGGGAVTLTLGAQLNVALLTRFDRGTILLASATVAAASSGGLFVLDSLGSPSLWVVVAALWTPLLAVGCGTPVATSMALDDADRSAGSAAALMGSGRFVLAACCAPLVGVAMSVFDAGAATGLVMGFGACIALASAWIGLRVEAGNTSAGHRSGG